MYDGQSMAYLGYPLVLLPTRRRWGKGERGGSSIDCDDLEVVGVCRVVFAGEGSTREL